MYDRADLYIPFIERSLSLLRKNGTLSFICADRWMKNKYGGPLRNMVSDDFHLSHHIDFTNCPAFHDDVVAYPAVTVISRTKGDLTRVARRPKVTSENLESLAEGLVDKKRKHPQVTVACEVVRGFEPWLLDNPARLNVIRKLEHSFPVLENTGCRVGIGVATGIDRVFIRPDSQLPIENERKLPLVMTRDIKCGEIQWGGAMLLNPFEGETSKLVDLGRYPMLSSYLTEHREAITRRHVAKKNPKNWFKTIDRIYPSLTATPKLLIPDIKGEPTVVYDKGEFYPHHNFYYVISHSWDLRALQAVLLSPVAQAFIATYSLRMRGDCLRYQAQYLRRIRLPPWKNISTENRKRLILSGESQDQGKIHPAVQAIFNLSDVEWEHLSSELDQSK